MSRLFFVKDKHAIVEKIFMVKANEGILSFQKFNLCCVYHPKPFTSKTS